MKNDDAVFHLAIAKLLAEIFDGPSGGEAYVLNPGDGGLLRQLESISAATASRPPAPSRPPIAAHADHIHYGLSLMNRWIAGEENPWANADWNASWRVASLTEDQWRDLLSRLRRAADAWRDAFAKRQDWDDINAAGAIAAVAHSAYHLGAIRQILGAVNR